MSLLKFLKANWLTILVGLIGILLSVHFYLAGLESRDPVFVVDENRTEIIQGERVATAPLRVTKADGTAIAGDIISVRMYFWNQGRLPIRDQHILEPLRVRVNDAKVEILDFQILGCSRDVVQPRVSRSEGAPKESLDLDFRILEFSDGFTLQVIYAGARTAQFELAGVIEGVPQAIGSESLEQSRFWSVYLTKLRNLGVGLLIMIIGACVPAAIMVVYERFKNRLPRGLSKALSVAPIVALGLIVACFLLMLPWGLIDVSKNEARKSLVHGVPATILRPSLDQSIPTNAVEATTNNAADAP